MNNVKFGAPLITPRTVPCYANSINWYVFDLLGPSKVSKKVQRAFNIAHGVEPNRVSSHAVDSDAGLEADELAEAPAKRMTFDTLIDATPTCPLFNNDPWAAAAQGVAAKIDESVSDATANLLPKRIERIQNVMSDSQMERVTDIVREHLDMRSMTALLNTEGWAGVVAQLPSLAKMTLSALVRTFEL